MSKGKYTKKPENKVDEVRKPEEVAEKTAKYFFKSEKELGFKKRNYFLPSTNKKYIIIAGEAVDEKTYNLFSYYCKKVFFKEEI